MERPDPDPAAGDARTLSFAAYRIDADLLERLLRYERTLLAELQQGWSPTAMASAHGVALASSGLSQEVLERALAVVRRFAGNREVAGRLRARAASVRPERAGDVGERLAVLAPIPRARVTNTARLKAGARESARTASRRSWAISWIRMGGSFSFGFCASNGRAPAKGGHRAVNGGWRAGRRPEPGHRVRFRRGDRAGPVGGGNPRLRRDVAGHPSRRRDSGRCTSRIAPSC